MGEKICLVCDRPIQLTFDRNYRCHAEGKPAIEFAGGFAVYAYHGTTLPEKYGIVPPPQWQVGWLFEENNAHLRRILIEVIGYDRLCQELNPQLVSTWQEYTLLRIKIYNSHTKLDFIQILKMICPSTGQLYFLQVPPEIRSAREAICWVNWDIDPEDFAVQT
ncbi:MAG: hypothetical protein N2235_22355 [Fischerella sp.]|nr:hypothetical protein [Fischerella sp.]